MTRLLLSLDFRPHRMPEVTDCQRTDDSKIVLRRAGRYLALSSRSFDIWNAFDGTRDLRSISQTFSDTLGRDVTADLIAFVQTLIECDFVYFEQTETPNCAQMCSAIGLQSARTMLEGYITFSPQRFVERCYAVLRPLFRPPMFVVAALFATVGAIAFLSTGAHTPLRPTICTTLVLGFSIVMSVIAHESAHAITLRHFGGVVSQAGVGWYWFAPTAFVNSKHSGNPVLPAVI